MEASADILQILIALAAGVALAASCGFRVFVPPLVMSLASLAGFLELSPGFAWMGTWQAALAFGVAAALEVAAYYIPAVDNVLDTISTPASVIAGTVLAAALLNSDITPAARWVLATVAGGGTALAVSTGTAAVRGASTATTAGLGNGLVSTGELVASTGLSVLSIALPVLAVIVAILAVIGMVALARSIKSRIAQTKSSTQQSNTVYQ